MSTILKGESVFHLLIEYVTPSSTYFVGYFQELRSEYNCPTCAREPLTTLLYFFVDNFPF